MLPTFRPLTRKRTFHANGVITAAHLQNNYTRKLAILQVVGGDFVYLQQHRYGVFHIYAVFLLFGELLRGHSPSLFLHILSGSDEMNQATTISI